jgi:hypothetical protein
VELDEALALKRLAGVRIGYTADLIVIDGIEGWDKDGEPGRSGGARWTIPSAATRKSGAPNPSGCIGPAPNTGQARAGSR